MGPLADSAASEYHRGCAERLFGSRVAPKIEVDPNNLHLLGAEMAGRVSLSGIQRKIALDRAGRGVLAMKSTGGHFILKPPTETYPELPQVELATTLAAKSLGLDVHACGLVRLGDGSLAFLARRFDRGADGQRYPMEDFAQLAELLPRDKYSGSAERCWKLLERYGDEPLADGRELWKLFFLSFWLGNHDLHLKNISLLATDGIHRLSPSYDLLCTEIYLREGSMAMPMEGKTHRYRPKHWIAFADRCGMRPTVLTSLLESMLARGSKAKEAILRSPLQDERRAALDEQFERGATAAFELYREARARSTTTRVGTNNTEVTGERIQETVQSIRELFDYGGVAIRKGSRLGDVVGELEWLGREPGLVWDDGGPFQRWADRARRALIVLLRMQSLRHGLARLDPRADVVRDRMKHLRGLEFDPGGIPEGQAGDLIFEIEVAAALSAHPRMGARLGRDGEPDVVLSDDEFGLAGFECKRPGSWEHVSTNIAKACAQLRSNRAHGMVAISLERLLGVRWVQGDGKTSAYEALKNRVSRRLDSSRLATLQAMPTVEWDGEGFAPGSVFGVLFLAQSVLMFPREEDVASVVRPQLVAIGQPNTIGRAVPDAVLWYESFLARGCEQLWADG